MGKLFFWMFMLAAELLIPVYMLVLGRRIMNKPPKDISSGYGYRSTRSMRSQEAWDFSQAYFGGFWVRMGKITLAASGVWMILLFGREVDTVGKFALTLTTIQLILLLAVIPATEQALKREFDDLGRKR